MGIKLCVVGGCMNATAGGARCAEHEREFQRDRNKRRGRDRAPNAAYRAVSLFGCVCSCCGTREDLTRHHVVPISQAPDIRGWIVPMCRPCNSSIGTSLMLDRLCPMHGGTRKVQE